MKNKLTMRAFDDEVVIFIILKSNIQSNLEKHLFFYILFYLSPVSKILHHLGVYLYVNSVSTGQEKSSNLILGFHMQICLVSKSYHNSVFIKEPNLGII